MKKIYFLFSVLVLMLSSCTNDEPKSNGITPDNIENINISKKEFTINNLSGTTLDGAVLSLIYNYNYEWTEDNKEWCGGCTLENIQDSMLVEQGRLIGYHGTLTKMHVYNWYIYRTETHNYLEIVLSLMPFVDKDDPNSDFEHCRHWGRNKMTLIFDIIEVNNGQNLTTVQSMKLKLWLQSTLFVEHKDWDPIMLDEGTILELTL